MKWSAFPDIVPDINLLSIMIDVMGVVAIRLCLDDASVLSPTERERKQGDFTIKQGGQKWNGLWRPGNGSTFQGYHNYIDDS